METKETTLKSQSNISPGIKSKMGKNLHNKENHPIEIIKRKIYEIFANKDFKTFDDFQPIVKVEENFDKLLIDKDHPARAKSDTYYVDDSLVLRTHTSAHQNELLTAGHTKFLVTGDVYRKDDIDSTHYPIFHQMEGVCVLNDDQDPKEELISIISEIVETLFPGCKFRINDDFFPFTTPSFEIEVDFNGAWIEVLGCGVVHPTIMKNCGLEGKKAWAFGLGLERLAMILFKITDIRYFWTEDERFSSQFKNDDIIEFKPYSNYPPVSRDVAFWTSDNFTHNGFCEIVREKGGDLIENVSVIDEFTNPKTNKSSKCYRIIYRSNDRTLTGDEINSIQDGILENVISEFEVEIR